ncbi:unnamed protein product [Parascedosporium putredinis]|uniref:FAD-binding domain-containing protein n=1 Tax=Parascedosporium putredinis TaxID=1442378 RepID=A0A9P1HCM6_9PEZI|nr:unnamed protein product [Parascedosporium putredinis]CAI8005003.1 unnamed protein product [Parascedosporium putredinis]
MAANTSQGDPRQVDDTIPMTQSQKTVFEFGDFDHSAIPLEKEEWPVIIIGSSMVGMTLGVLLGYHGIKSVSFDRHPSTAIHPRAALFLLRSVEIFRQLGLEDHLRENSALNFDLDAGMLIVEKLVGGKVIASLQESDPARVAEVTPSNRLWLTQNMFEPLLRASAQGSGATQEFKQAVVHYEEGDDGVLVVVQDLETGAYRKFKTQYLVACDGNRSATRAKEGIAWGGPGVVGENISINFKADLISHLGTRAKHGVTRFPPDSVTGADAKRYFRDATGIEDDVGLEVESISYWSVAGLNSERFESRKDAHNLAWKLAYVLSGKAAPSLLRTYSSERQPVAFQTMQQAYYRLQTRVFRQQPDEPELPDLTCEIGYRYPLGALVVSEEESEDASCIWEDPHAPLVLAGSRFPHVEITDSGDASRRISTLDLVKTQFLVVVADEASPWVEAAKISPLGIDCYSLHATSTPYRDAEGKVRRVCKLGEGEALLVRPDGFIAWRAGKRESGHEAVLQQVLREILG